MHTSKRALVTVDGSGNLSPYGAGIASFVSGQADNEKSTELGVFHCTPMDSDHGRQEYNMIVGQLDAPRATGRVLENCKASTVDLIDTPRAMLEQQSVYSQCVQRQHQAPDVAPLRLTLPPLEGQPEDALSRSTALIPQLRALPQPLVPSIIVDSVTGDCKAADMLAHAELPVPGKKVTSFCTNCFA